MRGMPSPQSTSQSTPLLVGTHHTASWNSTKKHKQTAQCRNSTAECSWAGHSKINVCVPKSNRPGDRWEKKTNFAFDRWERKDASQHYRGYSDTGRRLHVSGLPKPSTQVYMNQKIGEFLKDYAVEAISKTICPHCGNSRAPESPHYCYVDFASAEQAEAARTALDGAVGPWGTVLKLSKSNRDWEARADPRKTLPEGTMSWRRPAEDR
ncbi:hypothetical protein BJY00DRAFT_312196 [Aspergillus carlsbadensis]|nr:hypothetical protein BJY00DRAFT_312196 [Aspergillus carlsbadensis]